MSRKLTIIATAVVTAILTSAVWFFAFNIATAPRRGEARRRRRQGRSGRRAAGRNRRGAGGRPGRPGDPGAGVKQDAAGRYLHPGAGRRRPGRTTRSTSWRRRERRCSPRPPGTVEKLFFSRRRRRDHRLRALHDQRWTYYYAHLQGYAPGLNEGQQVERGQLIGRVGSTGNANPAGPHLHFAINRMQPGEKWYDGSADQPLPAACREKGQRLEARRLFQSDHIRQAIHEDQRRGHPSRQHHRI